MSLATLERELTSDHGTDLASLVIAYHRRAHLPESPAVCVEKMCQVAHDVMKLDALLLGADE